jgi:EAL and modified HD-GYP domain-containing signal transduction protein
VVNCLDLGLDRIIGPSQAFINVGREFILRNRYEFVPKNRVVFEILEDTLPDPDVTAVLKQAVHRGYRFALDDFAFDRNRPFLECCSFVKVDLRQVDHNELRNVLPALRQRNLKMIAEKVETSKEFETCKQLGFDYFQGLFFCKPEILTGRRIPATPGRRARLTLAL